MAHARLNAEMGTCIRRKVGAVAVRGRRLVAAGFNGNLPGTLHCDEGGCERCASDAPSGTSLDACVCVHAEENLIAWAARYGVSLDGATVYCTHLPCVRCLRLLDSCGITEIIFDEEYPSVINLATRAVLRRLT